VAAGAYEVWDLSGSLPPCWGESDSGPGLRPRTWIVGTPEDCVAGIKGLAERSGGFLCLARVPFSVSAGGASQSMRA
jgi:alkanesulfonate monooxygenase SsuD/methylene tetrahydromethanopterin reductase-like flavin-dependent oxidoreductase (luciferase family)